MTGRQQPSDHPCLRAGGCPRPGRFWVDPGSGASSCAPPCLSSAARPGRPGFDETALGRGKGEGTAEAAAGGSARAADDGRGPGLTPLSRPLGLRLRLIGR